ncbi:hypothetical protein MP638_004500 [Amoeboaphelidium occidentale]|nr:hypothetical protein MP638_004500 [Amoeboaphelidium occidentale]
MMLLFQVSTLIILLLHNSLAVHKCDFDRLQREVIDKFQSLSFSTSLDSPVLYDYDFDNPSRVQDQLADIMSNEALVDCVESMKSMYSSETEALVPEEVYNQCYNLDTASRLNILLDLGIKAQNLQLTNNTTCRQLPSRVTYSEAIDHCLQRVLTEQECTQVSECVTWCSNGKCMVPFLNTVPYIEECLKNSTDQYFMAELVSLYPEGEKWFRSRNACVGFNATDYYDGFFDSVTGEECYDQQRILSGYCELRKAKKDPSECGNSQNICNWISDSRSNSVCEIDYLNNGGYFCGKYMGSHQLLDLSIKEGCLVDQTYENCDFFDGFSCFQNFNGSSECLSTCFRDLKPNLGRSRTFCVARNEQAPSEAECLQYNNSYYYRTIDQRNVCLVDIAGLNCSFNSNFTYEALDRSQFMADKCGARNYCYDDTITKQEDCISLGVGYVWDAKLRDGNGLCISPISTKSECLASELKFYSKRSYQRGFYDSAFSCTFDGNIWTRRSEVRSSFILSGNKYFFDNMTSVDSFTIDRYKTYQALNYAAKRTVSNYFVNSYLNCQFSEILKLLLVYKNLCHPEPSVSMVNDLQFVDYISGNMYCNSKLQDSAAILSLFNLNSNCSATSAFKVRKAYVPSVSRNFKAVSNISAYSDIERNRGNCGRLVENYFDTLTGNLRGDCIAVDLDLSQGTVLMETCIEASNDVNNNDFPEKGIAILSNSLMVDANAVLSNFSTADRICFNRTFGRNQGSSGIFCPTSLAKFWFNLAKYKVPECYIQFPDDIISQISTRADSLEFDTILPTLVTSGNPLGVNLTVNILGLNGSSLTIDLYTFDVEKLTFHFVANVFSVNKTSGIFNLENFILNEQGTIRFAAVAVDNFGNFLTAFSSNVQIVPSRVANNVSFDGIAYDDYGNSVSSFETLNYTFYTDSQLSLDSVVDISSLVISDLFKELYVTVWIEGVQETIKKPVRVLPASGYPYALELNDLTLPDYVEVGSFLSPNMTIEVHIVDYAGALVEYANDLVHLELVYNDVVLGLGSEYAHGGVASFSNENVLVSVQKNDQLGGNFHLRARSDALKPAVSEETVEVLGAFNLEIKNISSTIRAGGAFILTVDIKSPRRITESLTVSLFPFHGQKNASLTGTTVKTTRTEVIFDDLQIDTPGSNYIIVVKSLYSKLTVLSESFDVLPALVPNITTTRVGSTTRPRFSPLALEPPAYLQFQVGGSSMGVIGIISVCSIFVAFGLGLVMYQRISAFRSERRLLNPQAPEELPVEEMGPGSASYYQGGQSGEPLTANIAEAF